jgi:hypothetical protein
MLANSGCTVAPGVEEPTAPPPLPLHAAKVRASVNVTATEIGRETAEFETAGKEPAGEKPAGEKPGRSIGSPLEDRLPEDWVSTIIGSDDGKADEREVTSCDIAGWVRGHLSVAKSILGTSARDNPRLHRTQRRKRGL